MMLRRLGDDVVIYRFLWHLNCSSAEAEEFVKLVGDVSFAAFQNFGKVPSFPIAFPEASKFRL